MAELTDIRETVRERYANAASAAAAGAYNPARELEAEVRVLRHRRLTLQPGGRDGRVRRHAVRRGDAARKSRRPRSTPRSAAASRPRSLTCATAKPSSTSARAPARTS